MVAGVDEVGIGAIAGPVIAAAVVFPLAGQPHSLSDLERDFAVVRDSKQLGKREHEGLACLVAARGLVGIGVVDVPELTTIANQTVAGTLASQRAVRALARQPDVVLLDGVGPLDNDYRYQTVAKVYNGTPSLTIAAASLVAVSARSRLMRVLDARYPGYWLERNGGHPSPQHLAGLARLGPSPAHHRHNHLVATYLDQRRGRACSSSSWRR